MSDTHDWPQRVTVPLKANADRRAAELAATNAGANLDLDVNVDEQDWAVVFSGRAPSATAIAERLERELPAEVFELPIIEA